MNNSYNLKVYTFTFNSLYSTPYPKDILLPWPFQLWHSPSKNGALTKIAHDTRRIKVSFKSKMSCSIHAACCMLLDSL